MGTIEHVGRCNASERELYLLTVASLDEFPVRLPLASPHFECLVVWDADFATDDARIASDFCARLLDAGCASFCAWGSGCERLHDWVDEALVERILDETLDQQHVMTSWHDGESLAEALWFFLANARPNDEWEATCRSAIAVVVGDVPERIAEVRAALRDADAFCARMSGEAGGS